ncbi:MAG: DUF2341 domain-containing protein, partial [Candidatus Odinarchaeota archaeon]
MSRIRLLFSSLLLVIMLVNYLTIFIAIDDSIDNSTPKLSDNSKLKLEDTTVFSEESFEENKVQNINESESGRSIPEGEGGTVHHFPAKKSFNSDGSLESDLVRGAWPYPQFSFRKNITVDQEQISGDLTDFPLLINLYDANLKDHVQPDGDDIIFTDSTGTKLVHEIELYNVNYNETHAHLVAWVKVPTLLNSSDTVISMYYSDPNYTNQEIPETVWDNNYVGVWHLSQGGLEIRRDSTSNDNDGTPKGYDNNEATDGIIGGADNFGGYNDYLEINKYPDDLGIGGTTEKTITAWVYTKGFNGGGIFEFGEESYLKDFSLRTLTSYDDWRGQWWDDDDDFTFSDSLNAWVYFIIIWNGTHIRIYANGTEMVNDIKPINTGNVKTLKIARWKDSYFNGIIDEIRISKVVR